METLSGMPSSSSLESYLCRSSHDAYRGGRASRRYAVVGFLVRQGGRPSEGEDLARLDSGWFAKAQVSEISTDLSEQLQETYTGISKGQAKGLGGG
jgi:hypothetical protein